MYIKRLIKDYSRRNEKTDDGPQEKGNDMGKEVAHRVL